MKLKDTGLLPIFEYVHDRKFKVYLKDSIDEIDLTEAFEKYLEKIGWKGLFEEWAFKLWVKEQGYIKLSDVELDVEKIKEMFDDRLVRVFDPTDAEYKNVRLTGAEADLIAKTVLANSKEVVRIKEEI